MSVVLAPVAFQYLPNNNNTGAPAAGFKLFTYIAGTSTKQSTWTDSTQATPNANPILLDANGFIAASSGSSIWCDPTLSYKFVWALPTDTDPPSSPLRTVDNITGFASVFSLLNSYGTDSGTANAYIYTHSTSSAAATLTAGALIRFTPLNTNTGPATLNADGTGAIAVIRANGTALTGGELSSLGPVVLQSTGTQWQIVSTAGAQPGFERTAAETTNSIIPTNYQITSHAVNGRINVDRYLGGTTGIATVGTLVGGSTYTNGTYLSVPLTGGSGFGASATIVVSGNAVTTVTPTGAGTSYKVGDVLSANNFAIGGTGSGFTINAATLGTSGAEGAFQTAINLAKKIGGTVSYGANTGTGEVTYLLQSPLDCTIPNAGLILGFTIQQEGNPIAITQTAPQTPTLIAKHQGLAVFDCTGSNGIIWDRVSVTTDTVTYPKTCWFLARNASTRGGKHTWFGTGVIGKFSEAVLYNYGMEQDDYYGNFWYNQEGGANAKLAVFSGNNIRSLQSPFVQVISGLQSCKAHNFIGGSYANISNNANADCFYLEGGVLTFGIYKAWISCSAASGAPPRAAVYMDAVNGPCNAVALVGVHVENAVVPSTYAFRLAGGAATPSGWTIDSCVVPNTTKAISAAATITCDNFHIRNCLNLSIGGGIEFLGTLQNSQIDEQNIAVNVNVSQNNIYHVNVNVLTVTSGVGDAWYDSVTHSWTPNTSALTITGALTLGNQRVAYSGQSVDVGFSMSAATSISCAAGTLVTGLPVPVVTGIGMGTVYDFTTKTKIGDCAVNGTTLIMPAINVTTDLLFVTARYSRV